MRVLVVLDPVDGGDAGMVQRRENLRLSLKPFQTLFVLGELVREDLDRDLPPKLRVLRPVHLAHTALPDGLENLVVSESGTGLERHDQFVGTRAASSSNQFRTSTISLGVPCPFGAEPSRIISSRSPSGLMSYVRPRIFDCGRNPTPSTIRSAAPTSNPARLSTWVTITLSPDR